MNCLAINKMASKQKIGYKCRIGGVFFLLLASIAGLVAVAVIQDTWKSKEYGLQYGIVIDSGSSRSNVFVYEWPGEKQNETGVVTEKMNCRVSGVSISKMKVDENKDNETLQGFKKCMGEVMKKIPAEKYESTPLFLGATAGMRLLHAENEQRSNEVLVTLREYLTSLPFMFQNASIISGQEEGLYGWITVNYLMGNFLQKNLWNKYVRPQGAQTVGSMDLGGASTQIAFAIQDDLSGPDYMPVKLYGYPYNVYTHSFLCYGKAEADKQGLAEIIQGSPDPSYIMNPCYPIGFNITMKASMIYNTECIKKPPNYDPDQELFFVGSANSEACGNIVRSIFDFETCSSSQCSFNGVEQPPVTGAFMAYAGFFYIARAVLSEGYTVLNDFNASIETFCHTEWQQLKANKDWVSEQHLRTYCYSAHYIFTLLSQGYKFDENTWKDINFASQVKGTSVGWSLGYMLSMSNMLPSEEIDVFPMTDPLFAGLIFLFSALTIVTFVVVFIILIRTCY
uniref:Ectonucleoside triphosphate diphosphohydrolase 3-like n=1 Tax=Gouania willdenowi TaxID=441366 RepID=A0A8C5DQI9_GOUWI